MKVIILLLLVSLLVGVFFLIAYIWSVGDGQFEDDHSPAYRIFFENINNEKPQ